MAALMLGRTAIFHPAHHQLQSTVVFLKSETDTSPIPWPPPTVETTTPTRLGWDRYSTAKYFNIFRYRYDSLVAVLFSVARQIIQALFPRT